MKKNLLLFFLLLLLSVAAYFVFTGRNASTLSKDATDFAVTDTAAITKIFLADRNGKSITLERKSSSEWLLNKTLTPKREFLKLFLEGVSKISVKSRVAKSAYNNVLRMLSSTGIKCEIYLHGEPTPSKVYYVGGQTESALGTFMMIENSETPVITEIPGFNGYLTPRYTVDLEAWKNTLLFNYNPADISKLSVQYAAFPQNSFSIINQKNGILVSTAVMPSMPADTIAVENYLGLYKNVYYEASAMHFSQKTRDSILSNPPSIIISITDRKDSTLTLAIFPMANSEASIARTDSLGAPLQYDPDRLFGYIENSRELVIIQHYIFDKLFRLPSDFALKPRRVNQR